MIQNSKTAAIVIIGNEVLSGRTQDTNIHYLAGQLSELGIDVMEVRVIPDDESRIIEAVNTLRSQYTYLFTTGGLGSTHDDITAASVAKAFGTVIERHPRALELLKEHYDPSVLNEARLRMADLPLGCELIENPISKAPGFKMENVYLMAGFPNIMKGMFDSIRPTLEGGAVTLSHTISCMIPEGNLADRLAAIQQKHPNTDIGSYPYFKTGGFGVSLVIRSKDKEAINAAAKDIQDMVDGYDPSINGWR